MAIFLERTQALEFLPNENTVSRGIFQINTREYLARIAAQSLTDIPDKTWTEIARHSECVWLMGIYQESKMGNLNAHRYAHEYRVALPDVSDGDIVSSPYAISSYQPDQRIIKSWKEFDAFRHQLERKFGLGIVLDFVPNHVALDHPWVKHHPDWFIHFTQEEIDRFPDLKNNCFQVRTNDNRDLWIAHGKDPNYPAWNDTAQLNYGNPEVQYAMRAQALELSDHCDGLRCDMAMLVNQETFLRTWGWYQAGWIGDFWTETIQEVKKKHPHFSFIAEAYWGEHQLLEQGFDRVYAKWFYDRMKNLVHAPNDDDVRLFNEHISFFVTNKEAQRYLLFLENHDEQRAASVFGVDPSMAFATVLSLLPHPGLLLHEGQLEGKQVRLPMQLKRAPQEPINLRLHDFYQRLFAFVNDPQFRNADVCMASTANTASSMIGIRRSKGRSHQIVCVNISPFQQQDQVFLPFHGKRNVYDLINGQYVPLDIIDTSNKYMMHVILPPWGVQCIELEM